MKAATLPIVSAVEAVRCSLDRAARIAERCRSSTSTDSYVPMEQR